MTEPQPQITVFVDGEPATTVGQAAARHGKTGSAMRKILQRYGVSPVAQLEDLPLYSTAAVNATIAAMPGKGANWRSPRAAPLTARVSYGERRPYVVANSLEDLRGPTSGIVRLPISIDWSGSPEKDLDDPGRLASVYEAVLREAPSVQVLNTWLNRDKLIELWPTLWLPAQVRRLWQQRFPQLPPVDPSVGR